MSIWNKEIPNETEQKPPEQKPSEKSAAELIAEALTPFGETLKTINARLDSMEESVVKKPQRQESEESVRQNAVSVLDDENVAFAQRLGPVVLRQFEIEARIVRAEVKNEYAAEGYGDLWTKFEGEINKWQDGAPLATNEGKPLRGDPGYIRNVVDMIFGREARKSGLRFDGKDKGFFLETGAGGGDGEGRHGEVADGLTDAQRRVFSRMRVPIDDAKKVMTKLKFIS